jgi:hypothetical protein
MVGGWVDGWMGVRMDVVVESPSKSNSRTFPIGRSGHDVGCPCGH